MLRTPSSDTSAYLGHDADGLYLLIEVPASSYGHVCRYLSDLPIGSQMVVRERGKETGEI